MERNGEFYVFQTYTWARNRFDLVGVGQGLTPCIALVDTERGEPLMLLPLAIEPRRLHKALVWMGGKISDLAMSRTESLIRISRGSAWRAPPSSGMDVL